MGKRAKISVELQQIFHGSSVVQDHIWGDTEWVITAVKQIQFSYYPWRGVSSFFYSYSFNTS